MKTKTPPPKAKNKSWFEFRNALGGRAEISIMDEIGAYGVSAADFKDALDSLPPSQPILLHICSDGGSITDGNEIYNALCAHPGGVEVEIGAIAASIASVIAMAGNPITMPENGFLMIHNPTGVTIGDSDDHRKNAEIMDKMKDGIAATYAKRTGKPAADLAQMMNDETWMTADEALANGFIDSVRADTDTNYVNFDLSKFRNSANFALRLQKQSDPAKELAGGKGGDTSASVTLSDLEKAIEPKAIATTPVHPSTSPKDQKTTAMTAEEQAAHDKAEKQKFDNAVVEATKKAIEAQNKLHGEIDAVVLQVRNRDKKDFSNLAGQFKQNGRSLDEFYKAIATSDEFKPFKAEDVIGSGVEITDHLRGVPQGSPGEIFIASAAYRDARDVRQKTGRREKGSQAVETRGFRDAAAAAGFRNASGVSETGLTSIEKLPGVNQLATRRLTIKDLLAGGVTNSTLIRYIQEQSFTNAATTVAEAGLKPTATFALTEVDSTVKKIAVVTKVSDELWADYLAVASYINQRLPFMVELTEENQLLSGDGTGSNLLGLLNTVGIQTQAKATDTAADAVHKALTKIRFGTGLATGGYEADGMVFNPLDWQNLRLTKDANGQYYAGGPFTGAYGNPGLFGMGVNYDSFWGKPVVITPAIPAGTALVGAFKLGAQYFMRQGLTIETTNSNENDFLTNLTAIRAELREALCVYLPLSFCQVTGL